MSWWGSLGAAAAGTGILATQNWALALVRLLVNRVLGPDSLDLLVGYLDSLSPGKLCHSSLAGRRLCRHGGICFVADIDFGGGRYCRGLQLGELEGLRDLRLCVHQ
jgi:hypothetical protein